MTPSERREALKRLRRNREQAMVYKADVYDYTSHMALMEAEMDIEGACQTLADAVERPELGFTKQQAKEIFIYDLSRSLRKARRLQELGR
jgi:nucleoid-associated protein YejK